MHKKKYIYWILYILDFLKYLLIKKRALELSGTPGEFHGTAVTVNR